MAVAQTWGAGCWAAAPKTVPKSRLWKTWLTANRPMSMPRSPIRATRNAFLPAAAADVRADGALAARQAGEPGQDRGGHGEGPGDEHGRRVARHLREPFAEQQQHDCPGKGQERDEDDLLQHGRDTLTTATTSAG